MSTNEKRCTVVAYVAQEVDAAIEAQRGRLSRSKFAEIKLAEALGVEEA